MLIFWIFLLVWNLFLFFRNYFLHQWSFFIGIQIRWKLFYVKIILKEISFMFGFIRESLFFKSILFTSERCILKLAALEMRINFITISLIFSLFTCLKITVSIDHSTKSISFSFSQKSIISWAISLNADSFVISYVFRY
jgi:hypothetical protein